MTQGAESRREACGVFTAADAQRPQRQTGLTKAGEEWW